MNKKKPIVMCAMSGGVDSSVSAALLKKDGYNVMGIFMKFWSEHGDVDKDANLNKCCSVESFMAAKRVCQILDIPLYTLNFSEAFKEKIVDNFLDEYSVGLTPNPCVRCNQFVKFGMLAKKAKKYGAEFVASGHYARVKSNNVCKLLKGKDSNKDQSYFLYTLNQEQLKHTIFPVGKYTKPEVRKLAKKFNLPVADKQESQELCFINEKDHYGFLKRNLDLKNGDIVTTQGKKIGEHKGLPLYTIGQRKGIEVGGTGPYYVVELDFKNNKLIVANKKDQSALLKDELLCKKIHWISGQEPKLPLKCKVRVRYRQEEDSAIITKTKKGYQIKFKKPQRAITSGQSAVVYKRDEVLGGGVIV